MSDNIESHSLAGEVLLVLEHGTDDEAHSLLNAIESVAGYEERIRIQKICSELFDRHHLE